VQKLSVQLSRSLLALAVLAMGAFVQLQPVAAQSPDYFIPGQGGGQGSGARSRPASPARPAPRPALPAPALVPAPSTTADDGQAAPQVQLPPVPQLPALPKGTAPPTAVIGVLGVPEVMRASTAAQAVEKVIGERRERLNQDAQKEQAAWRDMQQALNNDRAKLTPDQTRTRERELQERVTNAQRTFRERNNQIQAAAQVALAQIERTLIAVIRQVAESRGMNLVLHRTQVALNVNEFDITDQVAEQLNKVLPSVTIPPEGQMPTTANIGGGQPATGKAPATSAAPAAAPSAPAAASAPAASPRHR
jgi:Skp family chaperone for outer membrane proteins